MSAYRLIDSNSDSVPGSSPTPKTMADPYGFDRRSYPGRYTPVQFDPDQFTLPLGW